jgi:hypothetical protein
MQVIRLHGFSFSISDVSCFGCRDHLHGLGGGPFNSHIPAIDLLRTLSYRHHSPWLIDEVSVGPLVLVEELADVKQVPQSVIHIHECHGDHLNRKWQA